MKMMLTLLALGLLLAGCTEDQYTSSEPAPAPVSTTAPADSLTAAVRATEIYAAYFEENLKLNPVRATFLGDHRFNDQMPNSLSQEMRDRQLALEQEYLQKISAINPDELDENDRLSRDVFKLQRELAVEGDRFPAHLAPINQFFSMPNFFAQLGSGKSAQPFKTVADYDNWLGRVGGFVVLMDQAIANMHEGVEVGVVQPGVLVKKVLPQLQAHIVDNVEESLFYGPVKAMPASFSEADRSQITGNYVRAIEQQIIPAYRKLHDFMAGEYSEAARDTVGLSALPDGKAWYDYMVKLRTTTDLSADEVHQIGREEVDRIHDEMRTVMAKVEFAGDPGDFFEYTKTEARFYYEDREQMLQDYRDLQATVDALTPALFEVFPKANFEVRAVEAYREKSSSGASYQRAAPDGSRPGIFYVNAYDLSARPKWAVESLFLHEAAPGHHFQISIQQELDGLPSFRRFGGFTAYSEGWGLYAESLGVELGVYTDPYQHFGALAAELWRAIRLVVDTGIHAKGWSRQEVLDYMYANAPIAESRAVSEAERFMAIPGQALAYKIGQLKIRELRNRAEQQLGDKFKVRKFHTQVLKDGALPLGILEAKLNRWIAAEQSAG